MKTAQDPRHMKRVNIVKDLFAQSFHSQQFSSGLTQKILSSLSSLDQKIAVAAPQWPLDKVAKIDLAILRLAVYELTFQKNTPPKVVIDEAVELAKEFGGDSSASFVNGVLGTIIKQFNN